MNKKRISYLTLYNKCGTRLDTGGVNMMNMSRRSVDELGRLVLNGTEVQMTRGHTDRYKAYQRCTLKVRKVTGSTMEVITYSEV